VFGSEKVLLACALLFAAACGGEKQYTVSGKVSGATAEGVVVTLSGGGGISTTSTTSGGLYSLTAVGGSYTLTPSKDLYTFSPPSKSLNLNSGDVVGQDFTATALGGALDGSFGGEGKVTAGAGSRNGNLTSVAVQADGRILAGGILWYSATTAASFVVSRYLPDGTLDDSFASGGTATTTFGNNPCYVTGLAIQADQKIVAAGSILGPPSSGFALARYTAEGSLDPSFGSSGTVMTVVGAGSAANAVALQPDGKILVAGMSTPSSTSSSQPFALARYNADGSLDAAFGNGGTVMTAIGTDQDGINSLAVQADGKIVVAGYSNYGSPGEPAMALARYNADGSLDPTFGSSGKLTTLFDNGNLSWASGVTVQPDGKIVASGFSDASYPFNSRTFAFARYLPDGTLDWAFGSSGKVTGTPVSQANALAIQADGKIIFAGAATSTSPGRSAFLVARLRADGQIDRRFGIQGSVTTMFSTDGDEATGIAIQADGKVVVVGRAGWPPGPVSFSLARYWP